MGDLVVGARSGAEEPREPGERETPDGGADGAADEDGNGGPGGVKREKKQRSFWVELPILIGIALVLALLIKSFLVQAFSIPSDSMQNTLQRGDRVLVDKFTPWFGSEPERGEVVVFHDPGGWLNDLPEPEGNALTEGFREVMSFIGLMPSAEDKDLIKRVIGVGGDTVECKGTGPVKVNGESIDEPYVFTGNTPCSADKEFKVTVPEGRMWVMGDHRQDSLDSRYHMDLSGGGTVSINESVGRAVVIAWPVNRWSTLPVSEDLEQVGGNKAAALATTVAPGALGLAGAVPLVLWRRNRRQADRKTHGAPAGPGR